jgi:hypothetical protein
MATNYLIGAALVALAAYGSLEAWPLLAGPSIVIDSPADNAPFPGGVVAVRGRAARAARLSLNGAPLLRDRQGAFSTVLAFPEGSSLLTFAAADRFGRETRAARTVFIPATGDQPTATTTNN